MWIDVRVLINEIINIILRRLCRSADKIVDWDDFIWDAKVAAERAHGVVDRYEVANES